MNKLDLSQIPLSDLIVAIQYQVKRHLAEANNVVKVLTETFPDKAHVSKVVKEFQERVDWLTYIKDYLEESIEGASPRFIKEFKERHALLIAAFEEANYTTPAKPPKPARGPQKGPNKSCRYCNVNLRPENHETHEAKCRRNPANEGKRPCPYCTIPIAPRGFSTHVKSCERNPDRERITRRATTNVVDIQPCRHCKRPLEPKNLGRHEKICPKNPKSKCAYDWCRTNTGKEASDYCKRCNALLGIKGKPRGRAAKKKATKKKAKKGAKKKPDGQSSIEARIKDARRKKSEASGALSPHNSKQQDAWDKKHKAGVKKSTVKHARYLCENCGHVEMLKYTADKQECSKCKANTAEVVAKFNDKGERIEELQIEEQANALEEK